MIAIGTARRSLFRGLGLRGARWLIAILVLPASGLVAGCSGFCPHDFTIFGELHIPYEPERKLKVQLCHNTNCATVDDLGDGERTPELRAISARVDFTNTPEDRQVKIKFLGREHEPEDDYSVDIWLESGEHILHLVFYNVDRGDPGSDDKCDGVTHQF